MLGNRIRYFAFFAVTLLSFIGFRGRTLFTVMAVLVVMPFFTIHKARKMANRMGVNILFEKDMVGRNAVNVMTVEVDNKVYLPSTGVTVSFKLKNSLYEEGDRQIKVDVPVEGYGKNSVTLEIKAENCGYIYADEVVVNVLDLLSLASFKRKKEVEARYMVIPSYIYAPSDKTTYKPEDDSEIVMHEVGEDTSEIESIREYLPGDRMQRIHWKLTGKMEEMMVKEYAINYDVDINLVCEMVAQSQTGSLDGLLDALYSTMVELCDTNERYMFYYVGKDHQSVVGLNITSREEVMDALAQLFYVKPYDNIVLAQTLAKAAGAGAVMSVRWMNGKEDPDKLLYEFDNKVVLVWE